jgi:D-lyxose ketol-isomerase
MKVVPILNARRELVDIIRRYGGDNYDVERLMYLVPPSRLPKDKHAFTVKINLVRMHGTLVQKLERGEGSYNVPPGTYLCFRAHDGGALLPAEGEVEDFLNEPKEPVTIVTQKWLEKVKETFSSGKITDDVLFGLEDAIESCK